MQKYFQDVKIMLMIFASIMIGLTGLGAFGLLFCWSPVLGVAILIFGIPAVFPFKGL